MQNHITTQDSCCKYRKSFTSTFARSSDSQQMLLLSTGGWYCVSKYQCLHIKYLTLLGISFGSLMYLKELSGMK